MVLLNCQKYEPYWQKAITKREIKYLINDILYVWAFTDILENVDVSATFFLISRVDIWPMLISDIIDTYEITYILKSAGMLVRAIPFEILRGAEWKILWTLPHILFFRGPPPTYFFCPFQPLRISNGLALSQHGIYAEAPASLIRYRTTYIWKHFEGFLTVVFLKSITRVNDCIFLHVDQLITWVEKCHD